MADHAKLRFEILGPLRVTSDGRPLDMPRSAVLRGLLGVLLLSEGEPLSVHRLAATVWQDNDGQVSRGTVQVGVSRLRAWISALAATDAAVSVEHAADGYRLVIAPDAVDLTRLRALLAAAEGTADPARRYDLLLSAMQMRRGAVLDDLTTVDMSDPLFRAAEDAVRACGLAFATAALTVDRSNEAVLHLEELAEGAPFDEPVHARLIDLLVAAGRPAAALAHYERLQTRLADEYGVAPSEAVQRAHLNVLARDRHLEAPAGARSDQRSAPAQLPIAAAAFAGRSAELARLDALLPQVDHADGAEAGVVAINGTAGVGKTALAVHWAHQVRDRFADGQLYVNLRGFAATAPVSPLEALAGFLRALGEPAERIPARVDEAAALYRTLLASKRVLVILDDAHDVEQIRPLLPASNGCLVLVTSRNRLGGLIAREGAHRITLNVLSAHDAVELLTSILGAERVRAEPSATEDLARTCAYLPLALRIAAANIAERPAHGISDHVAELGMGNQLAALKVAGDPDSAVRAAFDLSYAALDPEAQRMFGLLGLPPGHDVTPGAAAALAGTQSGPARQVLDRLSGAALIAEHAPGRYAFHDLLRLYAAERVPEALRGPAIARYVEWVLRHVDAAVERLYPDLLRLPLPESASPPSVPVAALDDDELALRWLNDERANIAAVITRTAEHGPRRVAWLLASALRWYFWVRVSSIEWRTVAEAALTAADAEGDVRARAVCHIGLAGFQRRCGNHQEVVEHLTQAVRLCESDGWRHGRASALGGLSAACVIVGDLHHAVEHSRAALDLSRQVGSIIGQAASLSGLGMAHAAMGRLAEAAAYHEQALTLDRTAGIPTYTAYTLRCLGETSHALGRAADALDHLNQALELLLAVGDRTGQGEVHNALARLHRDYGRVDHALDCARTALALARDTGDRRLEAEALNAVASICVGRADYAEAVGHHRQALDLAVATGSKHVEAEALLGLASAEHHLGDIDEALAHVEHGATIARHAGYRILEGLVHTIRARVYRTQQRHADAEAEARRALAIHQATGYRVGIGQALLVLAERPSGPNRSGSVSG